MPGLPGTLPHRGLFPWLILIPRFAVRNCNCESNSFSEFCESFWEFTEPEGGLGNPCTVVVDETARGQVLALSLSTQLQLSGPHSSFLCPGHPARRMLSLIPEFSKCDRHPAPQGRFLQGASPRQ